MADPGPNANKAGSGGIVGLEKEAVSGFRFFQWANLALGSGKRRLPEGYALFNYEAASDKFTADPSPSDCGHACHMAVKAKDYIFHPYQKR
jgi:hypothetical protein